jgi:hypothetical protein
VYSSTGDATPCVPCPAGTYSNATGMPAVESEFSLPLVPLVEKSINPSALKFSNSNIESLSARASLLTIGYNNEPNNAIQL